MTDMTQADGARGHAQEIYEALHDARHAIEAAMDVCVGAGATASRGRAARGRRGGGGQAGGRPKRAPTDFNRFVKFKIGELKAAGGAPRKSTDLLKEAAHAWTNRSAEDLAEWRAAEAAAEAAHESVGSTEN